VIKGTRMGQLMVDWDKPSHVQAAVEVMSREWPEDVLRGVYSQVRSGLGSARNWGAPDSERVTLHTRALKILAAAQTKRREETQGKFEPNCCMSDFV